MIGELLKVGNTVVINIPDDNWNWGYHPVKKQKGTKAKITGFGEIHYSRIQNFGNGPGVYPNHSWVNVDGVDGAISSCFIELADKEEESRRTAKFRRHPRSDKREKKEPLRPLPDMKFWEGDIVTVDWGEHGSHWKDRELCVSHINYDYLGQKRNDGSPMPEYNITPTDGGGYVAVNETALTLVRRGNVWKYFNGEKIEFENLQEEANFFSLLGHTDEVRNPATDLFKWTKEEILQAVKDGTIDGIAVGQKLFGDGMRNSAIRFRDRDLGERVRKATIEGFSR